MAKFRKFAGMDIEDAAAVALDEMGATSRAKGVRTGRLATYLARRGFGGKSPTISERLEKLARTRAGRVLATYVGGATKTFDNYEWANLKGNAQ